MKSPGIATLNLQDPLDHPIWSALSTRQRSLALGDTQARRFPVEMGPFADIADTTDASLAALGALVRRYGPAALFTVAPLPPIMGTEVRDRDVVQQLVAGAVEPGEHAGIALLGPDDVADMQALAALAKPGPFGPRTHELGRFFGVRTGGILAAMTGERLNLDGHTELTAVCTHPDHRGQGLARALVAHVSRGILARGDTPFLHVFASNQAAINVYLRTGFTIRRSLHLTVLAPGR